MVLFGPPTKLSEHLFNQTDSFAFKDRTIKFSCNKATYGYFVPFITVAKLEDIFEGSFLIWTYYSQDHCTLPMQVIAYMP